MQDQMIRPNLPTQGGGRTLQPIRPAIPEQGGGRTIQPIRPAIPDQQPGDRQLLPVTPSMPRDGGYRTADFRDGNKNGVDDRDETGSTERMQPQPVRPNLPSTPSDGQMQPQPVRPNLPSQPSNGRYQPLPVKPPYNADLTVMPRPPSTPTEKGMTRVPPAGSDRMYTAIAPPSGMRWAYDADGNRKAVPSNYEFGPDPVYANPKEAYTTSGSTDKKPAAGKAAARPISEEPPRQAPIKPVDNIKQPSPSVRDITTPAMRDFFTKPQKADASGYIIGPNGRRYTETTYEADKKTFERRQAQQLKTEASIKAGLDRQSSYGKPKKPGQPIPGKPLPGTPKPRK